MIKSRKGITLVSLVITIALMLIISSTVVYVSVERFEINNLRKMMVDIELLDDKVSNYYLKYGVLPILRSDANNEAIRYTSTLNFNLNSADSGYYYIIDIKAMEGISLNYGKDGFESPNASNDVYIINERSHTIYYVKGIKMDGKWYHSLEFAPSVNSQFGPTNPQIKVISGTPNADGKYTTDVVIEIIPGEDKTSGIDRTEYSLNGGTTWSALDTNNNTFTITESSTIMAKTYNNDGKYSEATLTITIEIVIVDTTPPTKPTITDSGLLSSDGTKYVTGVSIAIWAGKDETEYGGTKYSKDGGVTWQVKEGSNGIGWSEFSSGTYTIIAQGFDKATPPNYSEEVSLTITIEIPSKKGLIEGEYVDYDVNYTDMLTKKEFTSKDGWKYLGTDDNGNKLIVSRGVPMFLSFNNDTTNDNGASDKWWDLTEKANGNYGNAASNGFMDEDGISDIPYMDITETPTYWADDNTIIGLFAGEEKTTAEGETYTAVGDYFISQTYSSKVSKVRTITDKDIANMIESLSGVKIDKDSTDKQKLNYLDNASLAGGYIGLGLMSMSYDRESFNKFFWIGYGGYLNDKYDFLIYSNGFSNKKISVGMGGVSRAPTIGFRPVVVLSSDVSLEDTNGDGVYEIIMPTE